MSKVDIELKKAFGELQQKAVETTNSLRIADVQIDTLKNSKQVASLTEREVGKLDSTTNMYESVGRAFILTPLDEIKANLHKKQQAAQEKITNLENNKSYLERSLKDAENNLREMVQQRRV